MKSLKIAVFFVIPLLFYSGCSDPNTSPNLSPNTNLSPNPNKKINYQKAIETFLAGIIKGEVDQSYNEFLAGTQLADKVLAIQQQKQQTSVLFENYGKLLSYEFIKKQQYGKSIIRLVYILKCEKTPVVWEFYFYKADADWQLVSLKFRDNYDLLVDK